MFGRKKRRRRRSEMRLGVNSINYETSVSRPSFSIAPALKLWQVRGPKLIGVLLLALLGWGLYALFSTPFFFVYGAEIDGNVAVSAREIYVASDLDSQSIFWVRSAKVVERITALPNIKAASVSLALPADVFIEVVERQPELLWQTDDTVWWVDQEGTVVPPRGEDTTDMLKIIDDDRQLLEAGQQLEPTIIEGAQMLRALAPDVSVIRYSRSKGLTVATSEGWPVYLGDGRRMRAKLVVLTALLADLKERNITPAYIDLRNSLRPVYRPKAVIQIEQPQGSSSRTIEPNPPQPVPTPVPQ
jgi:cell division protein FtsQ